MTKEQLDPKLQLDSQPREKASKLSEPSRREFVKSVAKAALGLGVLGVAGESLRQFSKVETPDPQTIKEREEILGNFKYFQSELRDFESLFANINPLIVGKDNLLSLEQEYRIIDSVINLLEDKIRKLETEIIPRFLNNRSKLIDILEYKYSRMQELGRKISDGKEELSEAEMSEYGKLLEEGIVINLEQFNSKGTKERAENRINDLIRQWDYTYTQFDGYKRDYELAKKTHKQEK